MIKKLSDQVLGKMTKQELCDYCRSHKIKGYSGKTKAQRVDLIKAHYKLKTDSKSVKIRELTKRVEKLEKPKKIVKKPKPKEITVDKEITYLEFRSGTSNKFYEIQFAKEDVLQIRYGRIGSFGKTIVNQYSTPGSARKQYDKTVRSKLAKGYTQKFIKRDTKPTKPTRPTKPSRPKPSVPDSKRINPMLAAQGDQYLGNANYILQQKYDGTRCVIIKKNGTIKMIGRSWKSDYAPNFPEIVADIKKIPLKSFVLDSELTFFRGKKDVFLTALSKKESRKGMIAKCMVFDILEYGNKDVRDQTFAVRNLLLIKLIPKLQHVEVVKSYTSNHKMIFEDIISEEGQGEGVVLKRLDSRYNEGGRTKDWIKVKGWKSDEAIIVGVTYGTGARGHTFGALVLAQYYKGSLKFVGKTSGFSIVEQQNIIRKIKPHRTIISQVVGIPGKKVKYWVNPEIVVEIKYQERTEDGKFRFPSFLRLRHDKTPKECIIK